MIKEYPSGVKISDLKKFIEWYPDQGEVWLGDSAGASNEAFELSQLNKDDLLISVHAGSSVWGRARARHVLSEMYCCDCEKAFYVLAGESDRVSNCPYCGDPMAEVIRKGEKSYEGRMNENEKT